MWVVGFGLGASFRHVFVHEAGHAVAAIDNDIEFEAVELYDTGSAPVYSDGRIAPGAVRMTSKDPSTWVQPNLVGSLRYAFAGHLAEKVILGDAIPGGFDEDVKQWKIGSGRTGSLTQDDWAEMLGQSASEVQSDTMSWASENSARIIALADHLEALTAPTAMSYDEVKDFLAAL